jgi:hypothetical protein
MTLKYIDDMPPRLTNDDPDSENTVHEEGLNEILTGFFGDGSNDRNNDHMDDSNDDNMGNYYQCNFDDKNLKDCINQATKTKTFPEEIAFPSTCREVCQFLVELGIVYKKMNSCENDFILYRDEYQDKLECLVCKENRHDIDVQDPTVPNKVLRHMPVITRLKQMFCSKSLSQLMNRHAKNMSKDGFMRILADSKALKHIEEKCPRKFKDEPHSIRFGLASSIRFGLEIDGVCPFSFISSNYCVCPVGLIFPHG